MLLAELLIRKDYLKYKMVELKNNLLTSNIRMENRREITDHLFSLIDEYQKYVILINRMNNSVTIKVADSELNIANALKIKENINSKMDILSNIIEMNRTNDKTDYSVLDLIKQRDKLMEEYIMISSSVFSQDWKTDIEQK